VPIIYWACTLVLTVICIRRASIYLSPVLGYLYFSFISITLFALVDTQTFYFQPYSGIPVDMRGNYYFSDVVYILGLAVPIVCLGLIVTVHNDFAFNRLGIRELELEELFRGNAGLGLISGALFLYAMLFFHMVELDFGLLWSNHTYLLLGSPKGAGVTTTVGSLFHHLTGPAGLICSVILGLASLRMRNSSYFWLFFPLVGYMLMIKFAQFSRWVPLIVSGLFFGRVYALMLVKKKYHLTAVTAVVVVYWLLAFVLMGRSSYDQGLLGVLVNADDVSISYLLDGFVNNIMNVFSGYIVFADALEVTTSYPTSYKILSFSPLISQLDGWAAVLPYQNRVNVYVPFNVFAELYHFGTLWLSFGSLVFIYMFYQMERLSVSSQGIFRLLVLMICIFSAVMMFFYPIRNVFRVVLFISIASLFINRHFQSKNKFHRHVRIAAG
jgi:hypothetical protein